MEKQDIKSMTQEELRAFLVSLGEKPFRTAQIYQWMHEKLASSFDDMTNLSKVLRQKLQDACEYVSLEKVRVQISQITEGIPVATTFATNHIRQIGIGLAKEFRHRRTGDKTHRRKLAKHSRMLFFFAVGATVGTVFCQLFVGKAIWVTILPLCIIFVTLLHADLTTEKNRVEQKPAGH